MKKTIKLLFAVCLFVLCVAMLASCGNRLDKPEGIVLDTETLTVKWNKVVDAKSYTVQISGEERDKTTKANFLSLEYLESGTYTVKIKANAGSNGKDSHWVEYEFVRPEENGLRYALTNADTAYVVTGGGSAEGDVIIPDTYREKPVVAIGDKAFYNNSRITSITIGANVKSIGEKAFTKSANLIAVTIPSGVETIGAYAFQNCKLIKSITIPSTVSVIEPFTFSRCDALESIDLGGSIVSIGEYAFSNCKSLTAVDIPDTNTYIGEYVFSDCSAIKTLDIGAELVEVDNFAFYNCSSLEALNFGNKVKYIRSEVFGNCSTLVDITIPDSVERIEYSAFKGCTAVETIKLGSGLTRIGSEVFKGTKPYEAAEGIFCLDGWLLEVKDKTATTLDLPEGTYGIADFALQACKALTSLDLSGIKYVGRASFYKCEALWEVIFDGELRVIGENAFRDCKKLVDVTLAEGLEMIDTYAFMNCSMLYELDIPDSVETIGGYAFYQTAKHNTTSKGPVYIDNWVVGCAAPPIIPGYYEAINVDESATKIANYAFYGIPIGYTYLPDSITYIGKGAFYKNAFPIGGGMSIRLSENLEYIGDYAFYGCANWFFGEGEEIIDLVTLNIPDTVKYIGRSAFYNCQTIVSLNVPGSVETIGKYAFYGCVNIGQSKLIANEDDGPLCGEITLGEGIQSIGAQAFRNCAGIQKLIIPSTVTYIGEKAFFNCAKLEELTIGSGLTQISDYAFYKCVALKELVLPDSVKTIGSFAFRGNAALDKIDLGSVEVIGDHAFVGCSNLDYINLPATVTDIEEFAFRGCTSVDSLTVPDTVVNVGRNAFYGLVSATIFLESATVPSNWDKTFNSMFRPIVLGCEISDDGGYVVSFTVSDSTVINFNTHNKISAPSRDGYTFIHWSADGSTFTAAEVEKVSDGVKLNSVWEESSDN